MSPADAHRRRFILLSSLRWVGTGCVIPTLVVLMQSRGLTLAQIGVAAAAQGVLVLLLELPTGGLADTLGPRRVLLTSGAVESLALVLFIAADSFLLFAVAWGVMGVSRALDSGPLEAWYVDRALRLDEAADIERGIAHGGAALSIAISGGALLAAFLVTIGPIAGIDALVLPVIAGLCFSVANVVAVSRLVTDDPARHGGRAREAVRETPTAVRDGLSIVRESPGLRALVLIELLWGAGLVGVEFLSGPRLVEVLGSPEQGVAVLGVTAAVAWSISGLGAAGTGTLVRWCRTPARAGVVTRIVQAAAVALMAVVAGPVGLITGYLAFYLVHGAANAVHYGMVHRLVDEGRRTTILSVSSLVARLGGTAADIGLGVVAAGPGLGTAFALCAILLLAGAPLYPVAGRELAARNQDARAGP
ncbi:MAG: MFS transporter [Acidimicrobiales bacterium]